MEEWKEYKIGDVCNITSSKRIFASEYKTFGIPFYRGKEIIEKQRGSSISNELFISEERYKEINAKYGTPSEGDMLLTSVGTLGIPYIVENNEVFYFKDGNLTWFNNFKGINNKYLYYWFLSPKAKHFIDTKAIGSTQKALTIDTLKNFDIQLPSIGTQEKIVSILSSIDSKITLNRRINDNLEQQAQTLFKSWFLDFEPFKDGNFVDSELGMIPEGWKVGTVSDVILSTISGDWGKDEQQGNYSNRVFCIRGADIPDIRKGDRGKMPTRYILAKNFESKKLDSDDIVVEISGGSPTQSTGRICHISQELIERSNDAIICTNFCRALKPKLGFSSYLYYKWDSIYNQGVLFLYENGTTGIKNLDLNGLLQNEMIVIPPLHMIERFNSYIHDISKLVQKNGIELEFLSAIRDTLLPELMSGELKINDLNS